MKRVLVTTLLALGVFACDKEETAQKEPAASAQAALTGAAPSTVSAAAPSAKRAGKAGLATAHLAASCEVLARVDVAALLALPAIKKEIVPALEEMKAKEPKDDSGKRFKAFLTEAGIDPLKDVSELALCITDLAGAMPGAATRKEPGVTLLLAASVKPGALVPALLKHGKADKVSETEIGGVKAVTDPKGEMFAGQAADGVILVAKGKGDFEAALKAGDAAGKLGLPLEVPIAFAIPGDTMQTLMKQAGQQNPFAAQVDKVGRAALTADLVKNTLAVRIDMADEKAAMELAGALKMILGQLSKGPAQAGPMGMAGNALKDAKVDAIGKELVAELAIPAAQIEALTKQLAESIRKGELR